MLLIKIFAHKAYHQEILSTFREANRTEVRQWRDQGKQARPVTPHVGVWIETAFRGPCALLSGHPSRRGVD